MGVLPGIIGAMQATEVIKVLTGIGEVLSGRLFIFDAARFSSQILKIPKNPNTHPVTELIDYAFFCGTKQKTASDTEGVAHNNIDISIAEFKDWQTQRLDFQLIDVRNPHEYEVDNLGGTLIPLSILSQNLDKIALNKPIVVHCASGARSLKAVTILQKNGFTDLRNLLGGIIAYRSS